MREKKRINQWIIVIINILRNPYNTRTCELKIFKIQKVKIFKTYSLQVCDENIKKHKFIY